MKSNLSMVPGKNDRLNSPGLTPRELELVWAITEGMSNKDIASEFGISLNTVKNHLTRIFDKAGVGNRLELGLFAVHHGWVAQTEHLQTS